MWTGPWFLASWLPWHCFHPRSALLAGLFKVNRGFSPPLSLPCPSDTTHTNGECPREQKEADSLQPFFFFSLCCSDTDSVLRVGWEEVSQEGEIIISLGDDACVCAQARVCVVEAAKCPGFSPQRGNRDKHVLHCTRNRHYFHRSCPAVRPNTRHFGALIVFCFFFLNSFIVFARHKQACI